LFGAYAFVVGTAWLGGRVYLAYTAHAIAAGGSEETVLVLTALLGVFSEHNEPLVNALRLAMLIVSVLWIVLISQGKTLYPRWVAIFSPIALLASIFVVYFYISPAIGAWLLPAAMNVVHVIIFALSIYIARGLQKASD
jgi:nicotinamide riboside transporter PnuC